VLRSFSSNLLMLPAVNSVPGWAENISCSLTLESEQSISIEVLYRDGNNQ